MFHAFGISLRRPLTRAAMLTDLVSSAAVMEYFTQNVRMNHGLDDTRLNNALQNSRMMSRSTTKDMFEHGSFLRRKKRYKRHHLRSLCGLESRSGSPSPPPIRLRIPTQYPRLLVSSLETKPLEMEQDYRLKLPALSLGCDELANLTILPPALMMSPPVSNTVLTTSSNKANVVNDFRSASTQTSESRVSFSIDWILSAS
uniref:Uncharacterized protein n=1 Tax=Mesocestoides corti TaxID=53468 RepID=A0A5K3FCC4_MESCO